MFWVMAEFKVLVFGRLVVVMVFFMLVTDLVFYCCWLGRILVLGVMACWKALRYLFLFFECMSSFAKGSNSYGLFGFSNGVG